MTVREKRVAALQAVLVDPQATAETRASVAKLLTPATLSTVFADEVFIAQVHSAEMYLIAELEQKLLARYPVIAGDVNGLACQVAIACGLCLE